MDQNPQNCVQTLRDVAALHITILKKYYLGNYDVGKGTVIRDFLLQVYFIFHLPQDIRKSRSTAGVVY
jgi:hypothetical protein